MTLSCHTLSLKVPPSQGIPLVTARRLGCGRSCRRAEGQHYFVYLCLLLLRLDSNGNCHSIAYALEYRPFCPTWYNSDEIRLHIHASEPEVGPKRNSHPATKCNLLVTWSLLSPGDTLASFHPLYPPTPRLPSYALTCPSLALLHTPLVHLSTPCSPIYIMLTRLHHAHPPIDSFNSCSHFLPQHPL